MHISVGRGSFANNAPIIYAPLRAESVALLPHALRRTRERGAGLSTTVALVDAASLAKLVQLPLLYLRIVLHVVNMKWCGATTIIAVGSTTSHAASNRKG